MNKVFSWKFPWHKLFFTLRFALLISAVFIIIEQIFRLYQPSLAFNLTPESFGELFLTHFLLLSLKNKRAIYAVYTVLILLVLFEFIHFSYFGSWIFPLEYYLFLVKFRETFETFSTVTSIVFVPVLLAVFAFTAVLVALGKMDDDRRLRIPYLSALLVSLLIFVVVRVYADEYSRKGARPNNEVNPVRNAVETLGYLFGRIVPDKITGRHRYAQPVTDTPAVVMSHPSVNVILIMGESLNRNYMSLYGYEKPTTPYLDTLKNDPGFLYRKGISSGVYTDVSLPSFFNMIYRPDGMSQILSTNTCLFKLAKENGFATSFQSAQSSDGLSNIKGYLCMRWIDRFADSSSITGDLYKNILDNQLPDYLKAVDLGRPSFAVLHQIGSHSPYRTRYPSAFERFNGEAERSEYENTVLYTDEVIRKIISYIKAHTKLPTYILFTSDHGESVGEGGAYGHGQLERAEQHMVPFFAYAINADIGRIDKLLGASEFVSHFDMARLIAALLGYDVSRLNDHDVCYVCGPDISGMTGYLELNLSNEGAVIKSVQ